MAWILHRRRAEGKLSVKPSLALLIFPINIIQDFFFARPQFTSLIHSRCRRSACWFTPISILFDASVCRRKSACAITFHPLRWLLFLFYFYLFLALGVDFVVAVATVGDVQWKMNLNSNCVFLLILFSFLASRCVNRCSTVRRVGSTGLANVNHIIISIVEGTGWIIQKVTLLRCHSPLYVKHAKRRRVKSSWTEDWNANAQKIGWNQKLMGWSFMQMDLGGFKYFRQIRNVTHTHTTNFRFHSVIQLAEWRVVLDCRCSAVGCRRKIV